MVEGGRSFHEKAPSLIKQYFRDDHVLKISSVLKAWSDVSLHAAKTTERFLARPAVHSRTQLKRTERFGRVKAYNSCEL